MKCGGDGVHANRYDQGKNGTQCQTLLRATVSSQAYVRPRRPDSRRSGRYERRPINHAAYGLELFMRRAAKPIAAREVAKHALA